MWINLEAETNWSMHLTELKLKVSWFSLFKNCLGLLIFVSNVNHRVLPNLRVNTLWFDCNAVLSGLEQTDFLGEKSQDLLVAPSAQSNHFLSGSAPLQRSIEDTGSIGTDQQFIHLPTWDHHGTCALIPHHLPDFPSTSRTNRPRWVHHGST